MKRMYKENKYDVGLAPQSLAATNGTGKYYPMTNFRRVLAFLTAGAMALTNTVKVELLQAQDALGTASKVIANAFAIITANTLVTKATVTLATMVAGTTVTVNGLVFTAHATVTNKAIRQFSIATSDTAAAVELVSCINDAIYGVPGVTASPVAGVITLTATVPGEAVITLSSSSAPTGACATLEAIAYVELDVSQLDLTNNFSFVAAKVTTTGTTIVNADLIRGTSRFEPTQQVGASAVI
ncbi:MAG: hypothetical protein JWM44_1193 [Bacilli bacterium]|nr:hypothetical protein [Bacilli bacterium]